MFAFEIAKQLQTVGDSIAFLGVLNLPPHIKQRIRQLNMVTAVLTLSLFLGLVEDDDPETFSPNIASMTYDDVLDDILAHRAPPGRMIELALDRAKLLRWAEVSNALHEMAWDYEPSGMVNIVDVFVAHPLKAVASNREDWFEKQISRWVHFSRTLPRFHEAEGEHFSMIGAEHVESFQAKLKAAMKARGV
jgi:thioesterase domain-containing protein